MTNPGENGHHEDMENYIFEKVMENYQNGVKTHEI